MKEKDENFAGKWYAHPLMRNALIAGALTGTAFGLAQFGVIPLWIERGIYLVAILLGGYHWTREGIEELIEEREIGIDFLMLGAAAGSMILGLWDEAAFLVFLYGVAEGLEEYTYARTRASIESLLDLAPKEAQVLRDGEEITVPARSLQVGDVFVVRPGGSIPTDGRILEGRSSVDEAPVTGESVPVEKKPGDTVFAATINKQGALQVEATATFEDNTLTKMIHLVQEAQQEKGTAQRSIEKFGSWYSPLVLLSAALLTIVPALLGAPVGPWASRAVLLLVAAAPCALIMSTPVATAAGISRGGRHGVLIKGGIHLENLGKVDVVAFDKTGTLTRGEPVVTDLIPLRGDEASLLTTAYTLERYSEHPLAKAIAETAEAQNIEPLDVTEFEAVAGYGVKGRIEGRQTYVGKPGLFQNLGHDVEAVAQTEALKAEGKTIMLVGTETEIEGIIGIRDIVRPQARTMIDALHRMGVKTVMLTGDNEATARAIAGDLSIDEIKAELKPKEKVAAVRELEATYGTVAMVGDGINDAPALAQAAIGIAMGTAGTDAAVEAADVALAADDLTKVPYAIELGKKARTISIQNLIFSSLVLLVLIPLAVTGMTNVALMVFLHEASEIVAIANGLRVTRA
jgi:Cd2+/Zn2+-exporting ATPase